MACSEGARGNSGAWWVWAVGRGPVVLVLLPFWVRRKVVHGDDARRLLVNWIERRLFDGLAGRQRA